MGQFMNISGIVCKWPTTDCTVLKNYPTVALILLPFQPIYSAPSDNLWQWIYVSGFFFFFDYVHGFNSDCLNHIKVFLINDGYVLRNIVWLNLVTHTPCHTSLLRLQANSNYRLLENFKKLQVKLVIWFWCEESGDCQKQYSSKCCLCLTNWINGTTYWWNKYLNTKSKFNK